MGLHAIAWRSLTQRPVASLLTAFSMALGVTLVVAVLAIVGVVEESFRNNSSLGFNLIVGGTKGGRLQLVLNSVYHLSSPPENIPYTYYEELLPARERPDGKDGKFATFVDTAIPLCLGDYYENFRVVGTTPELFDSFVFDVDNNRRYEVAQGRNFKFWSPEHGFFEAVVGATVAQRENLQLGDAIAPRHGAPTGHEHDTFTVVGILAPTGTPNDRAVFVNMEGFYLLDGHSLDEEATQLSRGATGDAENGEFSEENPPPGLPREDREVTSVLVRTKDPRFTRSLQDMINNGPVAQAVLPMIEIYSLFDVILQPVQNILILLTGAICVVAGIGILVSIYNSMSERRQEIALLRALGASRTSVMAIILWESVMLALGGGLFGWIAGHGLVALSSGYVEGLTGVRLGFFSVAPPVDLVALLRPDSAWSLPISAEFLIIPGLLLLSVLVGILPSWTAYQTDVAENLKP